jgi:uncharacterized protein
MVSIPGTLGYVLAGWDQIGLPPFSAGFVSIAAVLALMPTGFLAAKLGGGLSFALCGLSSLLLRCRAFGFFRKPAAQ